MIKRTKAEIGYSRTIQLKPYEPSVLTITTTVEKEEGLTEEDLKKETEVLSNYIDTYISEKL